jgi:hypothetical protein
MASGNSGALQVPAVGAAAQKQAMAMPQMIVQKNGYLDLSNKSNQDALSVITDKKIAISSGRRCCSLLLGRSPLTK